MKTEDAERYRRKSEECRANAKTATDDFDRLAEVGWNWRDPRKTNCGAPVTARERDVSEANEYEITPATRNVLPSSWHASAQGGADGSHWLLGRRLERWKRIGWPTDTTGRIGVVPLDQPAPGARRLYALLVMFDTCPECQGLAWRD